MKKTKFRRLAAMASSLLCCLIFTVPAYAQSSEPQPETAPSPAETEAEPETQNPFTPDGTGTVVDNAPTRMERSSTPSPPQTRACFIW